MADRPNGTHLQSVFYEQLHQHYQRHAFDNWMVWAGNHGVRIDTTDYSATLARAYIGPDKPYCQAQVRAELFVGAVDPQEVRAGDVDARLWTDANSRGSMDGEGTYRDDTGWYIPMRLRCDPDGVPELVGNNLVFESVPFRLDTTGVFHYSVDFSADGCADPAAREWINLSDMADNRNGVITVGPAWVEACPSVVEICVRKVGASRTAAGFRSGRFATVTAELHRIPADVIYLLPFFQPGYTDLHTGEDVRKGNLGSPYAVRDFFVMDADLITPPEECDLAALVDQGLATDADAVAAGLDDAQALGALSADAAMRRLGRDELVQLIGRAELRALTTRAHELGKRVIFDLVLMQTSRDCPLIIEHPEWYVMDAQGHPKIHRIAWLEYSDVALFDLVFNWPLQNYLSGIAPYWMETCNLDGVRIDASQTIDRPFLKQIKNRINAVCPDALVLGETLCPLNEAVDVPADMIYALMVDFHRDMQHATPLIDFLERMHACFAAHTVAMAYFENHDSPRATAIWYERYVRLLKQDQAAAAAWQDRGTALHMALLKNLQASLVDLSAGFHAGSNLACGLEWGSWWGEMQPTDFENDTVIDGDTRHRSPHTELEAAYEQLLTLVTEWEEVRRGRVYYHRNDGAGGDPADCVLGYVRYTDTGALMFLHNLDAVTVRQVAPECDYLPWPAAGRDLLYDTYAALRLPGPISENASGGKSDSWSLQPLQSLVVRLRSG